MSVSPDPQTWMFPPLGAPSPPDEAAAAFGPVARDDKIVLVWVPQSEKPDVSMICTNDSGTTYPIVSGKSSPYTYQFDQSLGGGDNNQQYICHFFFPDTSVGNSVTFEYQNTPEDQAITWQQDDQLQSALSAGATSTVSLSASGTAAATVTQTVTGSVTPGATGAGALPQSQPQSTSTSSSGLSAAAGAGIGVAAAVIFFALLILGFLIFRQSRKNKRQAPIPTPQPQYGTEHKGPPPMQQAHPYQAAGGHGPGPSYQQQHHNGSRGVHEIQ